MFGVKLRACFTSSLGFAGLGDEAGCTTRLAREVGVSPCCYSRDGEDSSDAFSDGSSIENRSNTVDFLVRLNHEVQKAVRYAAL